MLFSHFFTIYAIITVSEYKQTRLQSVDMCNSHFYEE